MKKIALVSVLLVVVMTMTSCLTFLSSLLDDEETSKSTKAVTTQSIYTPVETKETDSTKNHKYNTVKIFVEVSKNLIFSKYDIDVYSSDGKKIGTVKHGTSSEFELDIPNGNYIIDFRSAKDVNISEITYFKVDGNLDIYYKVSCFSDFITVTLTKNDYKRSLASDELKIDFTEKDLKGEDISSVLSKLKQKGFTNISQVTVGDDDFSYSYHKVKSVSISGTQDYVEGSIYKKDVPVVISYYEKDSTPVTTSDATSSSGHRIYYHSSMDRDIAKQGNSGIYSYRSMGGSYYIYYIVDFDHGYVYRFRNDEDTGMAAKIVSGDLNSYVLLRYKDSSGTWENAVHFKYKNTPDTLILQDDDGFETTFYSTDLSEAVKIYKTKTIYDYSPK